MLTALFAFLSMAGADHHQPDEKDVILAVTQTVFDAMAAHDGDMLLAAFHSPDTPLRIIRPQADGPTIIQTVPVSTFAASIAGSEHDLYEAGRDSTVLVSGPMAMVWMPFTFQLDGQHSHCGVNNFTLAMTQDGWKIIDSAYNHDTDCAEDGFPKK
ncbi:hypothetical protein [Parvularcula sp. LCG005]|uniref:hypothetical protein n=1 Tax=Parvularcula sp. LCG005 TaxID=3078805 RepID=UPI0029420998|nr:hypothetical protein [Parvularcula sp. LCG005]WOI52437.1 hypothetical protein RUI03_09780 [Parvularcula sp. LCG005]